MAVAIRRAAEELARRDRDGALLSEKAVFDGQKEALQRMAAGLAGRFGQALAGARAAFAAAEQAARPDHAQPERFAAEMNNARRALDQAAALVNGLRALVPEGEPAPTPIPLAEAVERAVEDRQARAARLGVALQFTGPRAAFAVRAESAALVGAVGPLIDNALDALEGRRGRVQVTIEGPTGDAGPRVVVEDDGPGFSATALERAFDPFFTTRPASDGLGLGLVFARAAAARCGGSLTLGQRSGGGARAVFELPRQTSPSGATGPSAARAVLP